MKIDDEIKALENKLKKEKQRIVQNGERKLSVAFTELKKSLDELKAVKQNDVALTSPATPSERVSVMPNSIFVNLSPTSSRKTDTTNESDDSTLIFT